MNINISKLFAQRLISLRKERSLSQESLALKCGIDRTHIGRIERLERTPSLEVLYKLAKGFDMSLSQLLDLKENEIITS